MSCRSRRHEHELLASASRVRAVGLGVSNTSCRSQRHEYELSVSANGTARAVASTVYGAMYAMESFVQLIGPDGELRHSTIFIRDAPQYPWRGLMVDSG